MKHPTRIGCSGEHSFCKQCVDDCYKHNIGECPRCGQRLKRDDIEVDDDLCKEILALEINCPKCQKWKGRLAKHKEHLIGECGKQEFAQENPGTAEEKQETLGLYLRMAGRRQTYFEGLKLDDTIAQLKKRIELESGIDTDEQVYVYI